MITPFAFVLFFPYFFIDDPIYSRIYLLYYICYICICITPRNSEERKYILLLFELSSTFRYHFFFSYLLKRNYQFDDFYKIIEYD